MTLMTFRNFCEKYYRENQRERKNWLDRPVAFEEYLNANFDFLKQEYKLYRSTGCVSCEE
jgi:hypothetical protein